MKVTVTVVNYWFEFLVALKKNRDENMHRKLNPSVFSVRSVISAELWLNNWLGSLRRHIQYFGLKVPQRYFCPFLSSSPLSSSQCQQFQRHVFFLSAWPQRKEKVTIWNTHALKKTKKKKLKGLGKTNSGEGRNCGQVLSSQKSILVAIILQCLSKFHQITFD